MSKYKVEKYYYLSNFEEALNNPNHNSRKGYELHSWSITEADRVLCIWVKCELPFQRIKLVDPAK